MRPLVQMRIGLDRVTLDGVMREDKLLAQRDGHHRDVRAGFANASLIEPLLPNANEGLMERNPDSNTLRRAASERPTVDARLVDDLVRSGWPRASARTAVLRFGWPCIGSHGRA